MKSSIAKGYVGFLREIKQRIRASQYEALKAVNQEMIRLYWDIGRMIVERQEKENNGVRLNLPQFNGHFKKYTVKWYTRKEKGVSDEREAAEIQPGV